MHPNLFEFECICSLERARPETYAIENSNTLLQLHMTVQVLAIVAEQPAAPCRALCYRRLAATAAAGLM